MQIGIDSFVINPAATTSGDAISTAQRMSNLLEEVAFADRVGLDVFASGSTIGKALPIRRRR